MLPGTTAFATLATSTLPLPWVTLMLARVNEPPGTWAMKPPELKPETVTPSMLVTSPLPLPCTVTRPYGVVTAGEV